MDFYIKNKDFDRRARLVSSLLGFALFFTISLSFASISFAYNIVILTSKSAAPYDSFISEFKKVLPRSSIRILDMGGNVKMGSVLMEKAAANKADVVVALGPRAAWAAKNKHDIPVIFSMLSDHKKLNLSSRTGIRSQFSLRQQLQTFKKIMPNVKKIGFLYSKASKDGLNGIEEIAQDVGLTIIKKEVLDIRNVAADLEDLLADVEVLWLRKDKLITGNARLLKQVVLLRALRKKIPIIGGNKWAVQNGALFCLFTSYQSIGAQAGEMVDRVISEGELGFQYPLSVNVFFNPHVAERLSPGVDIVVPRDALFVK
ncbi:ABC transporter substrate-binding protein [Pseudomonadota bacterium]